MLNAIKQTSTMLKLNICLVLFLITAKYSVQCWTGFENLEGGIDHIASASWGPGRFDIFGVAANGEIWHKVFSADVWSGWSSIGGAAAKKPGAFSIKTNWIDVMYTGSDQKLYRKTWDGTKWIDWKVSSNGGAFLSGPSLAATASDSSNLHVFGVGLDNQLYHCVIGISNNQWSTWEALGGRIDGDIAAVSSGSGRFDVFGIANKELWQKTYEGGWKNWNLVSGGYFEPGVGAASKGPGIINVFLKGLDNAVYHRQFSNGNWGSLEEVGGKIVGSPSAASPGSTRVDVFAVGTDRRAYRSYWETRIYEAENKNKNYGCYKGYCWARCSTTFIDVIANSEWCYTTKSGVSQDYKYVTCQTYTGCDSFWKCAGPCSV